MFEKNLKDRTQNFALRIISMSRSLPPGVETSVLGKQLLRCSTSVGANYRAACLAKSRADFISKIKICEEEADESGYWMELLAKSGFVDAESIEPLLREAQALTRIFTSSALTARKNDK